MLRVLSHAADVCMLPRQVILGVEKPRFPQVDAQSKGLMIR